MTYTTYEAFDKFVIIAPILQKLDFRLADATPTWTEDHIIEVKEAATRACEDFTNAFCESVAMVEDYEIDKTSYDALVSLYPIIEPFTVPFSELVKEDTLENVEKLLCLILFMIHIVSHCDAQLSSPTTSDRSHHHHGESKLASSKRKHLDSPPDLLKQTLDAMAGFVASFGVVSEEQSADSEEGGALC